MRIAQVIKAKNLRIGDEVMVFNADGVPAWNEVRSIEPTYTAGYLDVELQGVKDSQDLHRDTRVIVHR